MDHGYQPHGVIGEFFMLTYLHPISDRVNQLSSFPISQIVNRLFFVKAQISFVIPRITALVVKVLSSIAERQIVAFGEQGRTAKVVPFKEISESVSYLLSVQTSDGSFGDPHPILHRGVLVITMA